jgi:iron complex outermembrane receptor protein
LLSILTLPASAQDASPETRRAATVRSYNIGPGPLDSVLTQFARKAGAELSFDASLTRGKTSPGLSGSYTVQEGLDAF